LVVAALAICAASPAGFAQAAFSYSLSSDLGDYFKSKDVVSISQDVPLQAEGKLDGKVGNPDTPDAQYSGVVRVSYDPASNVTALSLREAWVKAFLGPVDLTVGNQIVAWGLTDIFTPVDTVNPQDYNLPISPEKIPEFMCRVNLYGRGFSLDLVAVPFWNGDILPGSRWQGEVSPPPGITIVSQSIDEDSPSATWDNVQFGGRLQASADWQQGFDAGLTYYRGINRSPRNSFEIGAPIMQTTTLTPTGTPGEFAAQTSLEYDRYDLLGIDADAALNNGLMLRTELAYKIFNETSWLDPESGSAAAEWVAAGEYTVVGIKTIGEYILDWTRRTQDDHFAQTVLLIASDDFDSRSSVMAEGAWNFDGSGFLSPQISYTLTDGLQASFKVYVFLGSSSTTFGQFAGNDFGEVVVKYAF
jgi:hypothetical protein